MPADRPLTGEERDELRDAAASVALDDLDALQTLIDDVRSGEAPTSDELAFHVGAWLGEHVRRDTGWSWVQLTLGEGLSTPALVPSDRSVALLPLELIAGAFDGADGDPVAIATRLKRGERPSGEPGTYAIIT